MPDWDRILRTHGRMVWATAYRLLGHADDAEECMQDAFLSAVELARRQRIRNWPAVLRHLATSRALDRLRARSRQSEPARDCAELDALSSRQARPDEQAQASELASRLRGALAELPPRHAEVFVLRFVEQMSYKEIGQSLALTTNAVGVLLHEARERLRELLGEGGSHE